MNIILFSIFVLRLRKRYVVAINVVFMQLLRESWQFECWDGDGKREDLGGYDGNEKGWFVVPRKSLDGRGTKRNSWGGCKLLRSGTNEKEWNGVGIVLSTELKEDLVSVSRNSDR